MTVAGRGGVIFPLLTAILLLFADNRWVAPAAEARRTATTLEQELAFYPSGRMLREASGGFQNVIADFLWLRAIQYYGEHRKTDLVFDKAAHVFRVLTDLDPLFVDAYRFGALVVVGDAGDAEGGYELLRKGIRANPDSWELLFDLGFHHFLHDEYARAASYLRKASSLHPGNERIARFTAYAEKKRGGLDASEEMWKEILETTGNDHFREAAEFALLGIRAARDTTELARGARGFHDRFGRFPRGPEDIVRAGFINRVPEEPFGERYVIQPVTGEVRSSFLLAREIRKDLHALQRVADDFREAHGRIPGSPEELVTTGMLKSVPAPWGVRYTIEPSTGAVRARLASGVAVPGIPADARGGGAS